MHEEYEQYVFAKVLHPELEAVRHYIRRLVPAQNEGVFAIGI